MYIGPLLGTVSMYDASIYTSVSFNLFFRHHKYRLVLFSDINKSNLKKFRTHCLFPGTGSVDHGCSKNSYHCFRDLVPSADESTAEPAR